MSRLTKRELEAACEALAARLAGDWGAEFGPDDDGPTREEAESAHQKLSAQLDRREKQKVQK